MNKTVSDMKPKNWKPGIADEAWKVMICGRDYGLANDLISLLITILTDAGQNDTAGIEKIKNMTGEQIITALFAYRDKAYDSVCRAFPNKEK